MAKKIEYMSEKRARLLAKHLDGWQDMQVLEKKDAGDEEKRWYINTEGGTLRTDGFFRR